MEKEKFYFEISKDRQDVIDAFRAIIKAFNIQNIEPELKFRPKVAHINSNEQAIKRVEKIEEFHKTRRIANDIDLERVASFSGTRSGGFRKYRSMA